MKLITNRQLADCNDRFEVILRKDCMGRNLYFAVAFFHNYKFIQELLDKGSTINLIVRLNNGTSPFALRQVLGLDNLNIRYFTSTAFHPKLYISKNNCAYVGSSNLSQAAMNTNNEINVRFDAETEEEIYEELIQLFEEYWEQAVPLNKSTLDEFEKLCSKFPPSKEDIPGLNKSIIESKFENTTTYGKKNHRNDFLKNFTRSYNDYLVQFARLKRLYSSLPGRKWEDIPLRIEIDRFLWWIREVKCPGPDAWCNDTVYTKDEQFLDELTTLKAEFIDVDNDYLESIAKNYQVVERNFSTRESILNMTEDELFDTLCNVHSFHDLLRFHNGGLPGLKRDFFANNTLEKIKLNLIHLIFDKGNYEERIYDCIYNRKYKLSAFGSSCVKELYGYMNNNDIPICNGRTIKSMEWLGFGKL